MTPIYSHIKFAQMNYMSPLWARISDLRNWIYTPDDICRLAKPVSPEHVDMMTASQKWNCELDPEYRFLLSKIWEFLRRIKQLVSEEVFSPISERVRSAADTSNKFVSEKIVYHVLDGIEKISRSGAAKYVKEWPW